MSGEASGRELPLIWPEITTLKAGGTAQPPCQIESTLRSASILFGLIHGLNDQGSKWLTGLFEQTPSLRANVVVAIYPGCPTHRQILEALSALEVAASPRVAFRLFLVDYRCGGPSTMLCAISGDSQTPMFFLGPSVSVGATGASPGQANAAFRGDNLLLEECRLWFDRLWQAAIPVTPQTVDVPALVPAPGTQEAAELWRRYEETCRAASSPTGPEKASDVTVTSEHEQKDGTQVSKEDSSSPSALLGVPKLDSVLERVARLYESGSLVTIDKSSRIGPIDAPIKAEWFGVESLRTIGAVSREIKYRISVLDPNTLRNIENKRKMIRGLLDRLSLPLGEGIRWIPDRVKPLLEQEMKRVGQEGHDLICRATGGDVKAFMRSRSEAVIADANQMYKEFRQTGALSQRVVEEILEDLTHRLEKACGDRFLPQVTYAKMQLAPAKESSEISPWGQALTLLVGLAEFPRKVFSDPFFLRGLRIEKQQLLEAMDVAGDAILRTSEGSLLEKLSRNELLMVRQIQEADVEPKAKCSALLALIDGKSKEDILRECRVN